MSYLSHEAIHQQYADAMRYHGPEATGRLWIADRIADAARDATIAEANRGRRHVRPVILSFGGLLVRLGERLEAAATVQRNREYA